MTVGNAGGRPSGVAQVERGSVLPLHKARGHGSVR